LSIENRLLVVFLTIIFVIIISFNSAQAYEIIYPVLDYKHAKIPNYCVVRPSDSELSDGQKDWMVQKGLDAVEEWNTTLQDAIPNYYKWQLMGTPIEKLTSTNPYACDWTISFQPEIPSFFLFGFVLGTADITNQEIVVMYKKLDPEEFHDVLLHEVGHSLGLGHFTTDDSDVMYEWQTSEAPPSIMIPNIHTNPGLTYITEVDIDKLKSIYGTGGFLREFEKEREESEIKIMLAITLDDLSVSPEKLSVKKYQTNMLTISGKLNKNIVVPNFPIYLLIMKPDLTTEVLSLYPTSDGKFQTPLMYDENSVKGEYRIEGVYLDHTLNFKPVTYQIVDENYQSSVLQNIVETPKAIPAWVKNTAKWWSEDLVDDESFVNGIEYLVQNKIISIPNLEVKTTKTTSDVPDWIKSTAGWWANGEISEDEFLKGLEYLIQQGIIQV